jgi:hypothetical protein
VSCPLVETGYLDGDLERGMLPCGQSAQILGTGAEVGLARTLGGRARPLVSRALPALENVGGTMKYGVIPRGSHDPLADADRAELRLSRRER